MAKRSSGKRQIGSALLGFACIAVAGGVAWSLFGPKFDSQAKSAVDPTITASISPENTSIGPSGLPVPRFVSLKAEKVNVRRGPSSDHPVAWVFQRKGLPVEIVAEFENWRRVRDSDGEEGWILQNMLAGKRTAVVAPWRGQQLTQLHSAPNEASSIYAQLAAGAMGEVSKCSGKWCEITTGGYDGFVEQDMLWGVYPGETVN
ncbi:MAG: SH3 domain-containing protein [Aestuariivirga sp.]|nr:SH3 domain-containing protein [Aestuariivirga sp.]